MSLSTRKAVTYFLLCSAFMLALGLMEKGHLLAPDPVQRGIGLLIGVLMMTAGNYLPKSRTLQALKCSTVSARDAERFAGWVLVLGGAVQAFAFLSTPLAQAKFISAYAGAGVVLAIACGWFALLWRSRKSLPAAQADAWGETAPRGEREMLFLVLAVLYMLVVAFARHQWPAAFRNSVMATWIALSSGVIFAAVAPRSRSSICRSGRA
jgi:hypothetical protein